MKVVLIKDLEGYGVFGDVISVKDGFARNYLIPRGIALPATEGNLKHVRSIISQKARKLQREKILREHLLEKVIVFVKTKKDARDIAEELKRRGFNVVSLHGDMTQRQRENSLRLFKEGKVKIVVATDVASRGLDIKGVSLVINYHIPEDPEVYIHRIGRTGRIGSYGKAYSLVTPEDSRALLRIKKLKESYSEA